MITFRSAWNLVRETYTVWSEAKAQRLGAALAFYSVISLAPLLILILAGAALIFGPKAAAGQLVEEINDTMGTPLAAALQDMMAEAYNPWTGTVAAIGGIMVLLFGASGVFVELQDAVNTIWQAEPRPGQGILGYTRERSMSFVLVLGTIFLLLVSLVVTSWLTALARFTTSMHVAGSAWLWTGVNMLVALAVFTVLFALIFRVLPDARVQWRDVWIGAAGTALLFNLGNYLLALYVGHAGVTNGYGAAGSLVVVLVWIYYSSQILLFGTAFTRVYARHRGHGIQPTENAVRMNEADRARAGVPPAAEPVGKP